MIEKTVRTLYSLLLNRQYQQIEKMTEGIRLNSQEIEGAISDYGRNMAPYPEHVEFDLIEITGSNPKSWSVVAPVYTMEEGLSDLSLEMTLTQIDADLLKVELDNIHVL